LLINQLTSKRIILKNYLRFTAFAAAAITASCGGGGGGEPSTTTPSSIGSNSGGASNACPLAANAFGRYPGGEICSFYSIANFMLQYDSTINFTAYYLDSGANYPAGTHNGIDFQTSDVAGKKCQTSNNCTEHTVYAPIEGKVVAKNGTFGAVIFEFTKPENGVATTYDYAVLHLKPGSSDHLNVGDWVPVGKNIGTQWNTSSVNGTSNDFSAHVHLEFSISGTNRVLTQKPDANSLSPEDFTSWINENLQLVANKKPAMAVNQINVSGELTVGKTITIRASGSSFPPTALLGIWTKTANKDQTIAKCNTEQPIRGTANGADYLEQRCILNSPGNFEIFVKAKSGEATLRTQDVSIQNQSQTQCLGTWSSQNYVIGAIESNTQSCPTGQSGSILQQHTCLSNGVWGNTTETRNCSTNFSSISPPTITVALPPPPVYGGLKAQVLWDGVPNIAGYRVYKNGNFIQFLSPLPLSFKHAYNDYDTPIGSSVCYELSVVENTSQMLESKKSNKSCVTVR
jgi:hypothetical protein